MKSDLDICMQYILSINYHVLPSQAPKLTLNFFVLVGGMLLWNERQGESGHFKHLSYSLFLNQVLPSQKFFLAVPMQKHS